MRALPLLLALPLMTAGLVACGGSEVPPAALAASPAAAPEPAAATPAVDAPAPEPEPTAEPEPEAPREFAVTDVPESTTTLPPFPFFSAPDGQQSTMRENEKLANFDREHFIAGDKIVAVEGRVFRDKFRLNDPKLRIYSSLEFQRNYQSAVTQLGGAEISQTQFTTDVVKAFGGRQAVDEHYHGACANHGCENHSYLIRQGAKEYWITISTGRIPLHGFVTVLERQVMAQSVGLLSAGEMQQALAEDGRVALYINFDTDKASLRPDAQPVITEIVKLLNGDPALKLSIEGHTDNTGTAERNRELSGQRANAVMAALVTRDIAADRLTAAGFGPDRPVAGNGDEAGRAKNRRVELVKQD